MIHNKRAYIGRFGEVYAHSPWVAEQAFELGPPAPENLPSVMRQIVEAAGKDVQLTLLRAYPDLAVILASSGAHTSESGSEQANAGLDHRTEAEFASLNDTYVSRFGFPYILAVRGQTNGEILEDLRRRVCNDPTAEFREALDQVHQIGKLRLAALLKG